MGALLEKSNVPQIVFWIDGYFSVYSNDPDRNTPEKAFEYAKKQFRENLEIHIKSVEEMPFDLWQKLTECLAEKKKTVLDSCGI